MFRCPMVWPDGCYVFDIIFDYWRLAIKENYIHFGPYGLAQLEVFLTNFEGGYQFL